MIGLHSIMVHLGCVKIPVTGLLRYIHEKYCTVFPFFNTSLLA